MFKHILAVSLFTVWGMGMLQAQGTAAPSTKAPFEGTIGYRLSYTGYAKEAMPFLPDSLTLFVSHPLIRARYHGGLSDSMGVELLWDASQHRYLMIDHHSQAAWTVDEEHGLFTKNAIKSLAKDTLAGIPCKVYEVPVEGGKDRYSISDSIYFPVVLTDSIRDSLTHRVPPFMLAGHSAIPLRLIRTNLNGTVKAKATRVVWGPVNPAELRMPSGYSVLPFDPRPKRHPILKGD